MPAVRWLRHHSVWPRAVVPRLLTGASPGRCRGCSPPSQTRPTPRSGEPSGDADPRAGRCPGGPSEGRLSSPHRPDRRRDAGVSLSWVPPARPVPSGAWGCSGSRVREGPNPHVSVGSASSGDEVLPAQSPHPPAGSWRRPSGGDEPPTHAPTGHTVSPGRGSQTRPRPRHLEVTLRRLLAPAAVSSDLPPTWRRAGAGSHPGPWPPTSCAARRAWQCDKSPAPGGGGGRWHVPAGHGPRWAPGRLPLGSPATPVLGKTNSPVGRAAWGWASWALRPWASPVRVREDLICPLVPTEAWPAAS